MRQVIRLLGAGVALGLALRAAAEPTPQIVVTASREPQSALELVAGVTLEKLWQRVEPDGWWPPVVSGTMKTTLGGCLAANIHGKNNFRMGTIGEHVVEFTAMLPSGAEVTCSPKHNADLFYSMIGGLGMLGIFTSITLQMKRIESGLLEVHAWPVHDLHEHLAFIYDKAPDFDYTVGWMDTMTGGKNLGRGQIHAANYLHKDEDPNAHETMKLEMPR